jgi:hypothetical protein
MGSHMRLRAGMVTLMLWAAASPAAGLTPDPGRGDGSADSVPGRPFIARVHYRGGGDWYNDPSCIPNLCRFVRERAALDFPDSRAEVAILDGNLFSYPLLFLTGHGRVAFSPEEAARLRTYLLAGGFLIADDDYGMDESFRQAMKTVFPDRSLEELPFSHGIYGIFFPFPDGLPKTHEHDNQPPRGFGIFDDRRRLMVFYSFESNISDGWADPEVHHDPEEKREEALRMGANIVIWALTH